jgi:hypothetical protein
VLVILVHSGNRLVDLNRWHKTFLPSSPLMIWHNKLTSLFLTIKK